MKGEGRREKGEVKKIRYVFLLYPRSLIMRR